jgi:hypothetical protein
MDFQDAPDETTPEERLAELPAPDTPLGGPRRAAVVVEDPRLVVVEGPGAADPDAIQGALEMLVKWAVRAHQGREQAMGDAQPVAASADGNAGDLT